MNRISPKKATAFICVLGVIAIIENGTFDQISQRHPAEVVAQQPLPITQTTVPISRLPDDPYASFSVEARRVIASDIAGQDEDAFGRIFVVKCVSASQSQRKFNGYGISSDVVVVSARFRLATASNSANSTKWTKDFVVTETIDAGQFQGLSSDDTTLRVVGTLKEQIQADSGSMSVLQKAFQP